MKTKTILATIVVVLIGITTALGQSKTESFAVKGNCGMCESRIEKAAQSVEGVTKADYDLTTHKIEVVYDESKTDIHKVHMAIAKAGHDTGMHKAEDAVYNALPGCCKYR